MRTACRVDANQSAVVQALRNAGASVTSLAGQARGCPDLLVGFCGYNLLIEIKDGTRPLSARQLTPDQTRWHGDWRGVVHVVTSASQAVELVRAVDRNHDEW